MRSLARWTAMQAMPTSRAYSHLERLMATLTIRNVAPEVQQRLRVRAAQHGRSMEAELRHIIKEAVGLDERAEGVNLAEAIRRRFARYGGVELEMPPREPAGPPRVKFDE